MSVFYIKLKQINLLYGLIFNQLVFEQSLHLKMKLDIIQFFFLTYSIRKPDAKLPASIVNEAVPPN